MLHNYTKHKNSKMFAVAYSSVGEAIDHIEVTEVNEKKAIKEFEQRMGIFPFGYYVIFTKTAPYYYNLGGGVSSEVYIEFLNKEKGYQKDVKYFKSYEQAVKWARKSFDKFSPDMIKHKMAGGGGIGEKIDSLEKKKKKLLEEWKIAKGAEKDKLYKKWQDVGIDLNYAQRDMYKAQEIEARNKMTIDFMIALEEDGIMTTGSHKNKADIDSINSIISMSNDEFSKYIKKVKNQKIDMIYREFQDWKQTYANGGGIGDFTIDNGGNYENAQGYELINQFNGTYQVLNPKGNDIAGVFETFEQAKKTVANWEKGFDMFKNGGGVKYIPYKNEEIMYEPTENKYYVKDDEFDSLKETKNYIDSGSPMSEKTINAYRYGAFKNGGGVGSDDSILNLFKKNKINKNSKEAYEEWENEVIEVIEYNENINRSQAQEIVDAKEFEMAHSWSNNTPAFNTAQVILGKRLVSSGRSNPFDYKGKTDKIREITKEMREIAREINPTKREVRREVRMELS